MIFVTGSNGFIGGHMACGLDDLKMDAVVHMAAISDTRCRDWNRLKTVNVDWTLQLAGDCYRQRIPFVYASSAAVYGNGNGPLNMYAMSKRIVDDEMARSYGQEWLWYGLRFFNVWGDGEERKGGQASLIHRLSMGLGEVWEPDVRRDFVHVGDCVAVTKWMLLNRPPSGVYDVGTGYPVSIWDLAVKYGRNPRIVPIPETVRPYYQLDTKADLGKLRSAGYARPFRSAV